jgi:phospholipase/lecithinase/hemolysin
MMSRRHWHISALAAAALIVAGCGGGDSGPSITRVVSFGDSLSDLGTYTIATSQVPGVAPYFGGRFTTNTHTGYTTTTSPLSNLSTIWVEWVAARAGVPITQAMLGFATTRIPCPAAASGLGQTCTAYAQGGSNVTNPIGINNNVGALTDPAVTQVAAHLARFGSFGSSDVVFVWAGANDGLAQLLALQAQQTTPAAAVAAMQTAGTELAALVKSQIAAKGATRIAVMDFFDPVYLPFIAALDAGSQALARQLRTTFNTALRTGLDGTAGVAIIDMNTLFSDVATNPSKYGITNFTTIACDPTKMAPATGGSALFCNAAPAAQLAAAGLPAAINSIRAGANINTWFWADGVHPSSGGHKVIGDFMISQIKALGWLPANQ